MDPIECPVCGNEFQFIATLDQVKFKLTKLNRDDIYEIELVQVQSREDDESILECCNCNHEFGVSGVLFETGKEDDLSSESDDE